MPEMVDRQLRSLEQLDTLSKKDQFEYSSAGGQLHGLQQPVKERSAMVFLGSL